MNKNSLLACCILPLCLTSAARAGINGIYKIHGNEYDEGEKYSFTGTVTISKLTTGAYALKFDDGDKAAFKFSFKTPLKDSHKTQTVNYSSSLGTGSATFSYANGHHKVQFSYKAKYADVKGSGSGIK